MPKYVWVALGMLVSAAGGVIGVWMAFQIVYRSVNQPADTIADLLGYGGVFAGFVGGVASLERGRSGEHWAVPRALMVLVCGLVVAFSVSPAGATLALNPFCLLLFVCVWPFALIGGLGMLAALWAGLLVAGVQARHAEPSDAAESR